MRKLIDPASLPAAIDGLIIKRGSVTAARYAEKVEDQARKTGKKIVEEANQQRNQLLEQAKAEGYLFGLDIFIKQMITSLDSYQNAYEEIIKLAKLTLIEQLEQSFTSDTLLAPLLQEFSAQYVNEKQVTLFLPQKLEKVLSEDINHLNKNIQVTWTDGTTISLEIGSEILTFNAENYSKNLYRTTDNIVYRSERYKKFSMLKEHALQQAKQLLEETLLASPSTKTADHPE